MYRTECLRKEVEVNIEAIRERLKGKCDLDSIKDCHALVRELLREVEKQASCARVADGKAVMLARLVVRHDERALEKAESLIRAHPEKSKEEVWDFLVRMTEEMQSAEQLGDEQLAADVMHKVWGELDMDSHESAVLEELVRRFREAKGIESTSEKEV